MSTSCSYGVTGTSVSNPSSIKSQYHVIDLTLCIPSGQAPPDSFAAACNGAGMSPILNNANDSGGGGGNLGYYQTRKAGGWMSAGGETNSDGEINTIMDAGLVYMDYAGWTGPDSLRSIYSEGIVAHGGGLAAWFETYGSGDAAGVSYGGCGITPDVMGNMAHQAYAAGAKEVGLLAGIWHLDWGAAPYLGLATAIENAIGSFGGFLVWQGYGGSSCDSCASQSAGLFGSLQSSWPGQTTTTIDKRVRGGSTKCPDGSTPIKCPDGTTVCPPDKCGQTPTGTAFSGFNEVDIIDYLTKQHNGQPTPGQHNVTITLG